MGKKKVPVSEKKLLEVGIFKGTKCKRVFQNPADAQNYLTAKMRKMKAERPKRTATPAQIAALAKGRAIRDANRAEAAKALGIAPAKKKNAVKTPKMRDTPLLQDGKNRNKPKTDKKRKRREKEAASGKYRKEEDFTSSSESGRSDSDSGSDA